VSVVKSKKCESCGEKFDTHLDQVIYCSPCVVLIEEMLLDEYEEEEVA